MTSETSIQDQRPSVMRDLHSDLLDEIKKGDSRASTLLTVCLTLVSRSPRHSIEQPQEGGREESGGDNENQFAERDGHHGTSR